MAKAASAAKRVYALVGADTFTQLEKLSAILAQFPDAQRIDVDGERAELADVLDECRSFAMFGGGGGGGKVVVVRDADEFLGKFREQLENYVAQPSDSSVLVLRLSSLPKNQRIYKAIAKSGQIEVCEPPKDVVRWITERARSEHKLIIAPDVAGLLRELVGDDLGRLDNELAKLALQTPAGNKVTAASISGTVAFQREQEMWDMTNELALGRPAEALKRWRQLVQIDPSTEFRAVTWLTMWLEEVGLILSGGNTSKLTWKYRERLPQVIKTAKSFGKDRHARAVDLLAELDKRSKSGLGDATQNVERFILSLAL